jgi:hypothetical protein
LSASQRIAKQALAPITPDQRIRREYPRFAAVADKLGLAPSELAARELPWAGTLVALGGTIEELLERSAEADRVAARLDLDRTVVDELIVVEWSRRQRCIHIHPIERMIETNLRISSRPLPDAHSADYLPIGVFTSQQDAEAFARKIDPILRAAEVAG